MNGYNIFLMVELARLRGFIDPQLEYDLTWNLGAELFAEFENSTFNVDSESESDCIEKFLQQKKNSL